MRGPTRKWAMKISRLIAVSTAAGLLSGGLFGYPQLLAAGWSPEAALWMSVLGFVGPALVVAGLAIASHAVSELLGLRRENMSAMPDPPRRPPRPRRQTRSAQREPPPASAGPGASPARNPSAALPACA